MTSIQKAQLEFLNETVGFYNISNRCVDEKGACKYFFEGKPGCAIGRKLPKELAIKLDTVMLGAFNGNGVTYDPVFNELPEELKELGKLFLGAVQDLHDEESNWDENGLSEYGKISVEKLKKKHSLI